MCRTKSLQQENYGETYGFDVLFGKGNYPCVNGENEYGATCDQCLYEKMSECPEKDKCLYLIHRDIVRGSNKGSLNYSYYFVSQFFKDNPRRFTFCDECHQLPDLVLDWAGCTVNEKERQEWWLPEFPVILEEESTGNSAFAFSTIMQQEDPVDVILGWLREAGRILHSRVLSAKRTGAFSENARKKATDGEILERKLGVTETALLSCPDGWYIQSGPRALYRNGRQVPGLLIRPLTARHHFKRYFLHEDTSTVLMSATIGNFEAFAEELGIVEYVGRVVPNVWTVERRPVYTLDAPKMSYNSTRGDYERQADVIAEAILGCPPDWSGIVHVTRKEEAGLLAGRLAVRGLGDRMFKPPLAGTTQQAAAWERAKRRMPGAIMVAWSFWEGFDGLEEKIDIVAKTPYPPLGNPYEKARQRYSGKFYRQRTAWALEQALGRTRRGREQDYDTADEKRGFVAIADNNWVNVRKYLSEGLREAIVTL